jgi:hypothetical protein
MIIKQSILILLLICFNSLKSQIKNPSFEQWSINGTIEEPFDWNTSNLLSSLDSLHNSPKLTPYFQSKLTPLKVIDILSSKLMTS